jgi:Protein of unknown function (DUF4199)
MEETTTPSISTRSVGIRYGLILAVISILYFVIMTSVGLNTSDGPASWVVYLLDAALIFLAHKFFKENGDGFMSFGQGMTVTFWLGLIATVLYMIFFYIYVKFIDTGFMDMIKDRQLEQMQGRGMSEEQIDQAMEISGKFMTPEIFLGTGLFFGVIIVVIIGLIVTAFTQKKNPEAFV